MSNQGISLDTGKTRAITDMEFEPPTTITQLRRFLSMVTQMNQFSPKIAELLQTLRELLSSKKAWMWGLPQQESFEKVKAEIATPQVLAHYDVTAETKVYAGASSYRLGAVLLQKQGELWKPVASAVDELMEALAAQFDFTSFSSWPCLVLGCYFLLHQGYFG